MTGTKSKLPTCINCCKKETIQHFFQRKEYKSWFTLDTVGLEIFNCFQSRILNFTVGIVTFHSVDYHCHGTLFLQRMRNAGEGRNLLNEVEEEINESGLFFVEVESSYHESESLRDKAACGRLQTEKLLTLAGYIFIVRRRSWALKELREEITSVTHNLF